MTVVRGLLGAVTEMLCGPKVGPGGTGISIGRSMGAILRNTISTSQVKYPSDKGGVVTV